MNFLHSDTPSGSGGGSFKTIEGIGNFKLVAFNPTKEKLEAMGINAKDEPVYTKVDRYKTGKLYTIMAFWLKNDELDHLFKYEILISDRVQKIERTNGDDIVTYVNTRGMFTINPNFEKFQENQYRPAFEGEQELFKFMMGYSSSDVYDERYGDSNPLGFTVEDFKGYVKKPTSIRPDLKELKQHKVTIKVRGEETQQEREVKMFLYVESKDGKNYQKAMSYTLAGTFALSDSINKFGKCSFNDNSDQLLLAKGGKNQGRYMNYYRNLDYPYNQEVYKAKTEDGKDKKKLVECTLLESKVNELWFDALRVFEAKSNTNVTNIEEEEEEEAVANVDEDDLI